ncbi:MAG: DUF1552 domain-containing protein [Alphaproteobacteria bacterium]|nr:DUF1552 domain-containing protein [Alphaproteobacteria bacterium]MCB9697975.1 DUF1552 domain-containing protein [Alphaproteobacteria bacterium]
MLPLPFLASLQARAAAQPTGPYPLVIMRTGNGVAQSNPGIAGENVEPDYYWPSRDGYQTILGLRADEERSTSILWHHAEHLLFVKGVYSAFPTKAELHASGGNQLLTAREPGYPTHTIMTYATGESVDNFIARKQPEVNGGEPLTLYTGRRAGMGEEILSYRGPGDLRAAEDDPWSVYRRLTGTGASPELRRSVNDLVLDQLNALMNGGKLSEDDRLRLEQHTDSVRDFEVLCDRLTSEQEMTLEQMSGFGRLDDNRIACAKLHCDVLALAIACDLARVVTLQIGDRTDLTSYTVNGEKYRPFHSISHREQVGDNEKHREIDKLHLEVFDYLLDVLTERDVLNRTVACFVSELGDGVTHSYRNLPWIVAGIGDGTLRSGQKITLETPQTNNKFLNTLIAATGVRNADGSPVDDFGDPTLERGLIGEIVKNAP